MQKIKTYLSLIIVIVALSTYIKFKWDGVDKQMVQKIDC